jgi:hypothetical protein
LTSEQENSLEKFLDQTRPAYLERFPLPERGQLDKDRPGPSAIIPGEKDERPARGRLGPVPPVGLPPAKDAGKQEPKKPLNEAQIRQANEKLPANLQKVPAVADALRKWNMNNDVPRPGHDSSDNSNTQFATLAL